MQLDFCQDPQVLKSVLDELDVGLFSLDASGQIVAWNAGAERITGYRADEAIGQPCRMLSMAAAHGATTLADLIQRGSWLDVDPAQPAPLVLARNGRELPVEGRVRPVRDNHQRVVGAVGVLSIPKSVGASAAVVESTSGGSSYFGLVGAADRARELFHRLSLASQCDMTVILHGERGSGRKAAAAAIHQASARSNQPFVRVDCRAIPALLLESELFGHVQGAFHGAARDKPGALEAARGGTLLLDEIEELPSCLAERLLCVLNAGTANRVGASSPYAVDVRLVLVAAPHEAPSSEKEDVVVRLTRALELFRIDVPALRERRGDIRALAEHFLRRTLDRAATTPHVGREALGCLLNYDWPGNVRELRDAMEHSAVTFHGDRIHVHDLPADVRAARPTDPFQVVGDVLQDPQLEAERQQLIEALRQTRGNRTAAARLLGVSRVTLWKRIKKFQVG